MKNLIFYLFIIVSSMIAQDELLGLLDDIQEEPVFVMATFKATRIVNAQSIELPRPKTMEFMIQHRFGTMKNGLYDLYGTDYASVRYDLSYGLNEKISFGAGRSSLNKTYDLFTKLKLARQSNIFPVSLAFYAKIEIETLERNSDFSDQIENRLTYDSQLLIARKLNSNLSFQVIPTWIHHNWVITHEDKHDLLSLGLGGRFKLTRRVAINADTFYPLGERDDSFVQSWGVGCDIETGGHVFQLILSNVQGAYESIYIENASGTLDGMDFYLGFNITRVFNI
tara:strand:+ start:3556 stop:4401 length:846 start_codon:yes stop_codon:yes gene_type:complete